MCVRENRLKMSDTKRCTCCNEEKSPSEFHKKRDSKRGKTYLRSQCKDCRNEKARNYMRPPTGRWKKYKTDAKRRGIDFELTEAEFVSFNGKPCGYCGSELDTIRLDRVNNDLGYFLENVVPCCFKCNSFKHAFKEKEFLDHITRVYLHQNNGKENGKQENSFEEAGKKDATDSKRIWAGNRYLTGYSSRGTQKWGRSILSWFRKILSL
jgi:hypothetical protein